MESYGKMMMMIVIIIIIITISRYVITAQVDTILVD